MRGTRNPVYVYTYRGFESHPLRQVNRYYKDLGVFGGEITTIVTTACLIRPLCEAIFHFSGQVIDVFTNFDPKSGGLAVLVFGNEMVSSVLDDVWGSGSSMAVHF